jgi:hypothetical protein
VYIYFAAISLLTSKNVVTTKYDPFRNMKNADSHQYQ